MIESAIEDSLAVPQMTKEEIESKIDEAYILISTALESLRKNHIPLSDLAIENLDEINRMSGIIVVSQESRRKSY